MSSNIIRILQNYHNQNHDKSNELMFYVKILVFYTSLTLIGQFSYTISAYAKNALSQKIRYISSTKLMKISCIT